jgi:hypothetical protein
MARSLPFGQATIHNVNNVNERLDLINKQVFVSLQDPEMRALALSLVSGCPTIGDEAERAELSRIFWFVKNNIEYRQDPYHYDLYATAKRTLQVRAGDCDCHAILTSCLLSHIGYQAGAKLISPNGADWHIYAVAGVYPRSAPTKILTLDTTQPDSYPGWEPPRAFHAHSKLITFSESGPIITS